ncbi:MAG TPA: AAA family ATPase [Thermomicrobiales bacterium]|nr:AAA family ATPase [Thermomicrobiales bacterium]
MDADRAAGSPAVPILLITGPVGVGKTTVAGEVAAQLARAGVAHALVDIDGLSECYPPPPGDRFNAALALRNLAAVWANYRTAGAGRLILAAVVESRADLAARMDRDRVEELVIETDSRSVADVARDVLVRAGWPAPPEG